MVYRLPLLPPTLVGPFEGWTPRESFSPSTLALFAGEGGCKRKWALRSAFGVSELRKSIASMLGSLIHGSLECYLKGGTVYDLVIPDPTGNIPLIKRLRLDKKTLKEIEAFKDPERLAELVAEAPKRALAGLYLLPNTRDQDIEVIEVERWIKIDTSRIIGGVEPLVLNGKIDLSIRRVGVWYIYDHKSTKGKPKDPWAYCKTPEELLNDPQAVFYALDVMLRHNLDALWIRWVYYLTDTKSHPQAKPVDVELRRADVLEAAYKWLLIACEMRELVRAAKAGTLSLEDLPLPAVLPPDPKSPCNAFGGCPYHTEKGGPCAPTGEVKLGDLFLAKAKSGKEDNNMTLADTYAQTQAAIAGSPPPGPLVPPEAHQPPPVPQGLPPGWEMGPQGPRQCAPPGYFYSQDGQHILPLGPSQPQPQPQYVAPQPPMVPPCAVAPPLVPPQVAPQQASPPPVGAPETPEAAGKAGRPAGSKNKAKDPMGKLIAAATSAEPGNPLRTLTIAQLEAVCAVLDAA